MQKAIDWNQIFIVFSPIIILLSNIWLCDDDRIEEILLWY